MCCPHPALSPHAAVKLPSTLAQDGTSSRKRWQARRLASSSAVLQLRFLAIDVQLLVELPVDSLSLPCLQHSLRGGQLKEACDHIHLHLSPFFLKNLP